MKLRSFLSIGAFLLASDVTFAQTSSTTSSVSSPSGTFDPVAALRAYGVNVSDYDSSSVGTTNFTPDDESRYNGCSFSVRKSLQSNPYPCCADLGVSCQCSTLSLLYPNSTLSQGTSLSNLLESSYWSNQQAEVDPCCVFLPSDSVQVAVALLLSRLTQCPFAVKSGGHAAFAGSSNIQGGVTINFANLSEIVLSSDKNIASVGPGNTWFDVYKALEPENLTVIGGRVAAIGVGGLTLGGGISFFSGNYGWACDNVHNYEVVTASGAILQVNQKSYPDLCFALRGGGNNFGIVTRFDLYTYPQGLMWGGSLLYNITQSSAILKAFVDFGHNAPNDPNAALIVAYAYAQDRFLVLADLEYALPTPYPPIFSEFLSPPYLSNTLAVQSLVNITLEFNASNPSGLRETYWVATFKLDLNLTTYIANEFMSETKAVEDVAGILPACVLQVITTDQLSHMTKNGGNALGISATDGPLILLNLAFMWENPSDDHAILIACQNIVNKSVAKSKELGLDSPYLYMNYASQFQSVVPSYGVANHAKLVNTAMKYDPDGVFQTLQPGYFKLNGPPSSSIP